MFDEATQKIIDNFDTHAKNRASDLLTSSTNKALDEVRELAFCLGYKAGVTDLSAAWKTSELAVKDLGLLFEACCAWRDAAQVPGPGVHEAEDRLVALIDGMMDARKVGTL